MVNIICNPRLKPAKGIGSERPPTVDEAFVDAGNLGDVSMGRHEPAVWQHKPQRPLGAFGEAFLEFGKPHKIEPIPAHESRALRGKYIRLSEYSRKKKLG
jgi:hypothetical protein